MGLMREMRRPWMRASALGAGAAAAVLVVSACGMSAPASSAPSASSPPVTSAAAAGASGSGAVISTTKGSDGTFLVGPSGKSVYLWVADTSSTSKCSGACAAAWPPVTTNGAPKASGSAVAKDLGMTKRSDGAEQVTYQGHPLYYYAGDSAAGQTTGQGLNQFGALWWLVDQSGSAITKAASGGGGAAPTSSSSKAAAAWG